VLSRPRLTAASAVVLGAGVTWNVSNVGAVADPLAQAYGTSLAVIGLFTTALFVTHLLAQLPAGRGADRVGARNVGLVAVAAVLAGNAICLLAPEPALAVAGRLVVGIGSGAGFVAGADYARFASSSPLLQGLYGGATMAGGGVAIAVVPQLEDELGWRAPYWSALAIALAVAVVLAASPRDLRARRARAAILADRHLLRLAVVQTATFGLSVVTANWIVSLLTRHGADRGTAATLGALILLGGIVTRPLGGLIIRREPRLAAATVTAGLAGTALGTLLLALPLPLAVLGLAAGIAGLAAGLPFAAVFSGAQRLRPDAPGAAIAFVNSWAVLTVLVLVPLVGLTFSLPGEGRLGFAAIAVCMGAATLVAPRSTTV
jgi:MFS transporter, NNP family, nitrate/nitrite transporter